MVHMYSIVGMIFWTQFVLAHCIHSAVHSGAEFLSCTIFCATTVSFCLFAGAAFNVPTSLESELPEPARNVLNSSGVLGRMALHSKIPKLDKP